MFPRGSEFTAVFSVSYLADSASATSDVGSQFSVFPHGLALSQDFGGSEELTDFRLLSYSHQWEQFGQKEGEFLRVTRLPRPRLLPPCVRSSVFAHCSKANGSMETLNYILIGHRAHDADDRDNGSILSGSRPDVKAAFSFKKSGDPWKGVHV